MRIEKTATLIQTIQSARDCDTHATVTPLRLVDQRLPSRSSKVPGCRSPRNTPLLMGNISGSRRYNSCAFHPYWAHIHSCVDYGGVHSHSLLRSSSIGGQCTGRNTPVRRIQSRYSMSGYTHRSRCRSEKQTYLQSIFAVGDTPSLQCGKRHRRFWRDSPPNVGKGTAREACTVFSISLLCRCKGR